MAAKCAACGSADTAAMLDTFVCHLCGAVTNYRGEVVSKETTEPSSPEPLVVSLSPADSSGKRVMTTQAYEGPVSKKVDADPGAFDRVAVVGSKEYDELHAAK